MADEAIIAVFKADIEQFKTQMAELQRTIKGVDLPLTNLVDKFGVPFKKAVDDTTASTDKFGRSTKSAHGSISVLSKGLQGITGLLGVTGRLFGVNTDKIEGLIFASQQFARVGQDIIRTQKLATAATQGATVATTAQTVAERILNAVRSASAGVVGLVIAGVAALSALVVNYISNLNEEEKALKRKQAVDKEQIKINNQLVVSFNERAKTQDATALAEGVRTGLITERQAKEIALNEKFFKQREADDKEIADQRLKASIANQDAFGRLSLADTERIEKNRVALLKSAEDNLDTELKSLREGFAKEDADEKKKKADEDKKKDDAAKKQAIEDEEAFRKKILQITIDGIEAEQRERDAALALELREQKEADDAFLQNKAEAQKKTLALAKKGNKDAIEILKVTDPDSAAAIEKEINNKRIEEAQKVADTIFKAQQEGFDKRQELLDKEIELQNTNIETQRRLAENGLSNTLAFEERRAAELRRSQQQEVERQKRVKLLETFLNSLAEFSKDDPKTAISKALLQVALAQAASAVFAEEGGIIGEIGARSNMSRKHKGGGDVLLHAQTGEGILSRREMDNLGKRNFHLLKDAARFPIRDDVFAMPQLAIAGGMAMSNAEVVKELQALRKDIRNQPRESWEVNKFGEYIKTSIENGVTEVTKGKMPKPRFK